MSVEHKHAASIDGRADANTNAAAERVPPSLLAPVQRGNLPHVLRELEGTFPHAQLDEQDKDGRTPLMICAITGREEIASALIDAGAELDKRDRFGWTAAMLAGIRGFNGIVRMLVQHGCSVHLGRSREHIDAHTATSLQTTFASVEGRTAEYARSSMVCCVGKPVRSNRVLRVPYTDAVFSLGQDSGTLPEGLTLDAQTGDIGGSPTAPTTPPPPTQTRGDGGQQRGVAVAVVRVKCADRHMPSAFVWLEVRVSVCVGVSAAEEQKLGARAVVACKAGREEVARGLLFAGADVCAGGGHAESLLHAAVSMGSESLLREALEAGAHHHRPRRGNREPATSFVDVRDRHGRTPLILSCILQCSEMARMLLSFGAGVDETDAFGRTGLMICVAAGSAVLARVLLDHGASVEATKGPSGQSVVDIAQQSGFRLVLELVRQVQRSAAHATRPAEHKIMTKSIQELPPSSSSSFSSQGIEMEVSPSPSPSPAPALEREGTSGTATAKQSERLARHARNQVRNIAEFVSSEAKYASMLTALCTHFVVPLSANDQWKRLKLNRSQAYLLSLDAVTLETFHVLLAKELALAEKSKDIATVFIKYGPTISNLYKAFTKLYARLGEVLTQVKGNRKFQAFLAQVEGALVRSNGVGFHAHAITPMQRVMRYPLLFRDLLSNTEADDPRLAEFTEALAMAKVYADESNAAHREAEQQKELMEYLMKIKFYPGTLVIPSRVILAPPALIKVVHQQEKSFFSNHNLKYSAKPRVCYFFNDKILWTNRQNEYKGQISLIDAATARVYPDIFLQDNATGQDHSKRRSRSSLSHSRSSVSGVLKHDLYVFATKAISETINPSDESALQSSTNLFQMQFESEMLCAEYERLLDDACRALHSHTE